MITDQRWWIHETAEDRATAMAAVISKLENIQNDRTLEQLRHMSIYTNRPLTDMAVLYTAEGIPVMPRQILNKTQALVDTLVSKHVLSESKCAFFTENGDWDAKLRAEALDCGVFGEFERLDLYQLAEMAFRDALICGDGWLKFYERNRKVCTERTFPLEIILDEEACYSNPPTEMYQRRYVTKEWMKAVAPEFADEVDTMQVMQPPYAWPNSHRAMVRLDEGWHLPCGEEKGYHILSVGHISIVDEEWTHETFPFQRIMWSPTPFGGYSQGLVEQLAPLQLELNKMLKTIHHALKIMAVPRIWQQAGTRISPEYDSMIGNVYKYSGVKPEIDSGTRAVAPELVARADWVDQRMSQMARLSDNESQGFIPRRNDSQPAFRDAVEVASSSHAWVGKMWERFFVGCARQVMRTAAEIPDYEVYGRRQNSVYRYKWKDIALKADEVVIKLAPANPAALSPTGKRQAAQLLIDYGVVTDRQDIAEILIDIPDVKAILGREISDKQLIEQQLWRITREQEPQFPDEWLDLQLAVRMARQAYNQTCQMKNAPEKVKAMLVDYIRECQTLLTPPPAPLAPPMAPQPGVMNGSSPVPGPPVPGGTSPGPVGIPGGGSGAGPGGPPIG